MQEAFSDLDSLMSNAKQMVRALFIVAVRKLMVPNAKGGLGRAVSKCSVC